MAQKLPADKPSAASRCPEISLPLSAFKVYASADSGLKHARTAPPTADDVLFGTRRRNACFEQRFTTDYQRAPMARTDDRVQLAVAHAASELHNRRALGNVHPARKYRATRTAAAPAVGLLAAPPKVPMQRPAGRPDGAASALGLGRASLGP